MSSGQTKSEWGWDVETAITRSLCNSCAHGLRTYGNTAFAFLFAIIYILLYQRLADKIEDRIEIPVGAGLAGACFQSKAVLRIEDAYDDERFNVATDQSTGYRTKAVLCVPILSKTGACEGVAEMMNKNDESGLFTEEDVALCQSFAGHIRFAVHSAHKRALAKRAEAKSKSL